LQVADLQGRQAPAEECLRAHRAILQRLRRLAETGPVLSPRALALNGKALMVILGRPAGPWVGQLQAHLLDQVLEDPASNTPETLAAFAKAWENRD
jgi:hypothetical protein